MSQALSFKMAEPHCLPAMHALVVQASKVLERAQGQVDQLEVVRSGQACGETVEMFS